jgi:galactokinase
MDLGQSCFEEWELVPESFTVIEEKLKNEGALAVKLTGAGAGGFVVALWK